MLKFETDFFGSYCYTSKSDEEPLTLSFTACFKRALGTMVVLLIFHSNTLDSEMTFPS